MGAIASARDSAGAASVPATVLRPASSRPAVMTARQVVAARNANLATTTNDALLELTEAYFGKNDYYPFTRDELEEFDPKGFELMQEAWGSGH